VSIVVSRRNDGQPTSEILVQAANAVHDFMVAINNCATDFSTVHMFRVFICSSLYIASLAQNKGVFGYPKLKFSPCHIECLNLRSGY
jgi:hypothetical protein